MRRSGADRTIWVFVRLNLDVPRLPNQSPLARVDLGNTGYRPAPPTEGETKGWGLAGLVASNRGHCFQQPINSPLPQRLAQAQVGDKLPLKLLIHRAKDIRTTVRLERLVGTAEQRELGSARHYARRLGCIRR